MIIDVSEHQGAIDWEAVKCQIEAAILRCGYGKDIPEQDDKQWSRNVSECERLGIPYGVYFYSYAGDEAHIASEIRHALRLLQGRTPTLPVFFDAEQKGTESVSRTYALRFCETVKAAGYKAGIYCSENWWKNHIKDFPEGYVCWIAKYGTNNGTAQVTPDVPNASLWQFTSRGSVNGIKGNVDCSIKVGEAEQETQEAPQMTVPSAPLKSVDEVAGEVLNGAWGAGDDRKNRLTAAGYDYAAVQSKVNELCKPKIPVKSTDDIAREVIAGKWGVDPGRSQKLRAAGYDPAVIQSRVNALLGASSKPARKSIDAVAREVIAGKWGTDPARRQKLTAAGYDAAAVQKRVNELMR